MFGLRPLMFGMLLGSGGMFFAHRYHVVNTADGVIVVPRTQHVDLMTAYADTREWDTTRWSETPELAAAMAADGRSELMLKNAAGAVLDQAAAKLGISQPESGWLTSGGQGSSGTGAAMPEIVFRNGTPSSTPTAPAATTPTAPGQNESLLDRLSRQFGGTSTPAATTPAVPSNAPYVPVEGSQTPQYRSLTPVHPAVSPHSTKADDPAGTPQSTPVVSVPATSPVETTVESTVVAIPEDQSRHIVISMPILPASAPQATVSQETVSSNPVAASPSVSEVESLLADSVNHLVKSLPLVQTPTAPSAVTQTPADVVEGVRQEIGKAVEQKIIEQVISTVPRGVSDVYQSRPLPSVHPQLREQLSPSLSNTLRSLTSPGASSALEGAVRMY